jgi:hypothetical protein
MAIIMSLAAAAAPALSAFRRAQRLDHSGRIMTSALNDARRLAITKHARHCVVLYEYEEIAGQLDTVRHAMAIYQEPTGVKPGTPNVPDSVTKGYWAGGYVGQPLILPQNVRFKQELMEARKQVNLPDENSPIFQRHQRGQQNNDIIAFRADGTIEDRNDDSPNDTAGGGNFFQPDEGYYQVPDTQRADIVIMETTPDGNEVKAGGGKVRRCLVDLNLGTGRAQSRVFDIGPGFEKLTPQQQTPGS